MSKNAHIFGLFPYISLYLYRQKNDNFGKITLNVSKMYTHVLLGQIAPEHYDLSIYLNFLSNLKCHFYPGGEAASFTPIYGGWRRIDVRFLNTLYRVGAVPI